MNKNALLKLAIASILTAFALQPLAYGKASDPAALIKAGRQNLAKQTSDGIAAAHKNFSDAVKLAPKLRDRLAAADWTGDGLRPRHTHGGR